MADTAPPFADVDTPALLLDGAQLRENIRRVQQEASAGGMQLRPHAKAHKSAHVAKLQMEAGATGICCSKLAEAEVMVAGGLRDILVTTPAVGALKIARLVALARSATMAVVVDDAQNLADIARAARDADVRIAIVVEVDVGQNRCGVGDAKDAVPLALQAGQASHLTFRGLQGYQGLLQSIASFEERESAVQAAMARLAQARDALAAAGIEVPVRTGGGTGSFPIDLRLKALTELQPGSYVTMDATYTQVQWQPDVVAPLGQPLRVLTSVVSTRRQDKVVVDAGWKAVSCDAGPPKVRGRPDLRFEFAGDEHGAIVSANGGAVDLRPGERVELVPGHCDTTVNLYDRFVVHEAGTAHAFWPIEARGRCQ
ncbi:DSD1 family PLP-dependent enzyme [Ramlibacter sp.]|uniref:DSD1 family PLP-dependent enzyme n=1 Tax=Ramlibacter sp. TaxID=1917967 RepID=UPI003D09B9D3